MTTTELARLIRKDIRFDRVYSEVTGMHSIYFNNRKVAEGVTSQSAWVTGARYYAKEIQGMYYP